MDTLPSLLTKEDIKTLDDTLIALDVTVNDSSFTLLQEQINELNATLKEYFPNISLHDTASITLNEEELNEWNEILKEYSSYNSYNDTTAILVNQEAVTLEGILNPSYITQQDTAFILLAEEEISDLNDSLSELPSFSLYNEWDTVHTHFPKFDIKSMNDVALQLTLCDERGNGYVHPFGGDVTSNFGPRRQRFHYGIDINLETGDEVVAAFDGKVRIAKRSKTYGNLVVIRHSNGLETYYAHLSKINVTINEDVTAGQTIGLGGNTGRSYGSHLHFEVRYLGNPINPTEMISFEDRKLISDTFCLDKQTFRYIDEVRKLEKANNHKIHIVKKGDTLGSIAKRYHTSVKVLSQKNKLRPKSVLKVGQRIKT